MKRYFAAAGALLLGTSTVALAADVKMIGSGEADAAKVATDAKTSVETKFVADTKFAETKAIDTSWDGSLIAAKSDFGATDDVKVQTASLDKSLDKMSPPDGGAKLQTASMDGDAKFQTASLDSNAKLDTGAKFETASVDSGWKLQNTSLDTGKDLAVPGADARAQFAASDGADTKLQTASGDPADIQLTMADKTQANVGMGGPLQEDLSSAATLTPQPATQNYPACEPGPGDDRCIQLYERGVRDQLASWSQPTGGLLDPQSQTAMGGPFEPVGGKTADTADASVSSWKPVYAESELAMNDDSIAAKADTAAADIAASSADTATATAELAGHEEFAGVGGPVEAQSGYPPCSEAGPGEDRCIQLYEAGVSGAGN